MIELCITWATFWIRLRTRSVVTTARDDFKHATWAENEYKKDGYMEVVRENNDLVHAPNMAGDLLLAPVNAIKNSQGEPMLLSVFEKVYRISREDALDLLRYAHEKNDLTRHTEAAKLFTYMANYLDEYFSWRNIVSTTVKAKGGAQFKADLASLDTLLDSAIGVMLRIIRERRDGGPEGVQVEQHWPALERALVPVNQAVTGITNRYALDKDSRFRNETVRRAVHGFPTKSEFEMQEPPWMPSMLLPQPPPPSSMYQQNQSFQGQPTGPAPGQGQVPNYRTQAPPFNNFAQPPGYTGYNNFYPQANYYPGNGFDAGYVYNPNNAFAYNPEVGYPTPTGYPGQAAPRPQQQPMYGGGLKRRRKTPTGEGELKRARWSDDLEPQDFEPLVVKRPKIAAF
ncbi:hypothetical protein PG994_002885 [Apiospora phragmitis]|uniref:Uncharacterized protein n=1 Tax=Apiospora phragmitis TaxID=2905665 RepID=A0ABR1W6H3_9PEZI